MSKTLRRLYQGSRMLGAIKSSPEDFVVGEIVGNGTALEPGIKYSPGTLGLEEKEGKFCIFVLQKRDWNTAQALKAIAKMLRKGIKSMGFAGTKDRMSVSVQLCSAFGATASQLTGMHVKDIQINGAWLGDSEVRMGDL